MKKKKRKRLQSMKSLKDEAWWYCSQYIRNREATWDGKTHCYTCAVVDEPKNMDAGHFKHGNTKATWLMEENIHVQCKRCNKYLSGNLSIYTLRMIDQYGREKVDELHTLSLKSHYFTRKELDERRDYYKNKLRL